MISGSNISLFREQFVYVPNSTPYYWSGSTDGTNLPGQPGWYPDGLIPFSDPETGNAAQGGSLQAAPFAVLAGSNQVIWVDVHVPVEAPPGDYQGTFVISSDQGQSSVQVNLHVWNFQLPTVPSFKTAFQARLTNQNLYMQHELLRNRVSPEWDTPTQEQVLVQQWGLTSTNMWFSSGIDVSNCASTPLPPAPSVAQFQAAAAQHASNLLLYNFTADEISRCPQLYPALKQWAANMHSTPIQNLVTVVPVPELEDDGTGTGRSAVDIWVELPEEYDSAVQEIQKVLAKGDSVWSYNVLVQDGYSPKLDIVYTPIEPRIEMGFISQSLGLSGFQQWLVDDWSSDPWNDVTGYSADFAGEGLYVYPGQQVGVVGYAPSMRLKWIRDGVDDYELVQILKSLGQGTWALQQAHTVGPDWRNWTRDYTQVEAVRTALGNEIELLMNARSQQPAVSVSSGTLNFGTQRLGTSASQIVTIANTGTAPLVFAGVAISGPFGVDFTETSACGPTLAPKSTCNITVTFYPSTIGSRSATATVSSNDPVNPHIAVGLAGFGSGPVATLSPTSIAFGPEMAGVTSAAQIVILSNTGNAPMTISGLQRAGANPYVFVQTNNCPSSLPAGASCTILATFTPTAVGPVSALFSMIFGSSLNPASFSLTGSGTPNFQLSPPSLRFQQTGNQSGQPQGVTLTNLGPKPLTIGIIEIYGSAFTQQNNCGSILAPQSSCTVEVSFRPGAPSSSQATSLVVNSGAVTLSTILSGSVN